MSLHYEPIDEADRGTKDNFCEVCGGKVRRHSMRKLVLEQRENGKIQITIYGGATIEGCSLIEHQTEAVIRFIAHFFDLNDKQIAFRKPKEKKSHEGNVATEV